MIDFATLQGLAIPEGEVTEITDAAGRVLWSSAPPFDGTIYLRPSADISVDSTITLTPTDATAAYMLINEEISDGAATVLDVTATADNTADTGTIVGIAKFKMAGYAPRNITKANNVSVTVCATTSPSYEPNGGMPDSSGSIYVYLSFGEYRESLRFSTSPVYHGFEEANYAAVDAVDVTNLLAAINTYITANSTIPSIELELQLDADKYTPSGGKESYGYARVSNVQVIIDCE